MEGALLDLDGIIADTATYHFLAWKNLIKKNFNTILPNFIENKTKGLSREDSLDIILKYLNISVSSEQFDNLIAEKNKSYVDMLDNLNENDILPGINSLISEFQEHNVKIALASASKNGPTILKKLGIYDVFDTIINPSLIAHGKPAPDIFLAAAKELKLSPKNCIGIEDSIAGISAINSSGAISIAVGGAELWHAKKRVTSTSFLNYEDILYTWNTYHK